MPPTFANGKICYLQIPAKDVNKSANFYHDVFGWSLRRHEDGSIAFDDGVGEVSGTWTNAWPPSPTVGVLISVMVDSVEDTMAEIKAHGGEIVQGVGGDPGEITARFRDPGGNVLAIYQHPMG